MRQIGLLLEKHSTLANTPGLYKSLLPPHLESLTLEDVEQRELVARLCEVVVQGQVSPNMLLWTLGTPASALALAALLNLICEQGSILEEEILWEALAALDRLLVLDDGRIDDRVTLSVELHSVRSCLNRLKAVSSSRIERLKQRILLKVEATAGI